jgi:phage protein D
MGLKPQYRIIANSNDISVMVAQRLKSLRLTDAAGLESDILEITLVDDGIKMPPTGAELTLHLGYDGELRNMGLFIVDEIELQGFPSLMVIRARATIQDKSSKGKKSLRSQQNREWKKDTLIKSIVEKIARDHGMTSAVGKDLASIKIPHTLQTDESDLHFLTRLAKKYDATVKPADGKIVFAKTSTGKSVSGKELAPIIVRAKIDCRSFRMTQAKREQSGTVVAYYHASKEAKRHAVHVGDGSEPIRRLRMP